jgi:parallel beta-helix repeat protein
MLALLLLGMPTFALNIQSVGAIETIYIKADGSVVPSSAPIERNGDAYTLTSNITSASYGICIERDNVTLDGGNHTLQGPGGHNVAMGVVLEQRCGITIKNLRIQGFFDGIYLGKSSNNTVVGNNVIGTGGFLSTGIYLFYFSYNNTMTGNNITGNDYGIWLISAADNNRIIGNDIASNTCGISLDGSSDNSVVWNSITENSMTGIEIVGSGTNKITRNNITHNHFGIGSWSSSGNTIYHNNLESNTCEAFSKDSMDVWDNGYPSGGNYWSDYSGSDICSGLYQNETGSDSVGDTPYITGENISDRYPLMKPYVPLFLDLNDDRQVDIEDIFLAATAFGSCPGHPRWDPMADFNGDDYVGIDDILFIAVHFGKA